jgi:carboxylesterase
MAGYGWGIIVQGGFLFIFDLLHALAVPRREAELPALDIFSGPEHAAFRLSGRAPAAVLVHGFGGTPAEMRGLAEALHRQGWTVDAPLLPGFGADIATLTERRYEDWLAAVEAAGRALTAAGHRPVLLVGYSLGAGLALVAAQTLRPAGVIVLAPFWWPERWWTRIVEFIVRPFLPIGFRPLRKADLADPNLRQGIAKFMPGLDLDDPAAQAALREFRVPLGLIDQVRGLSRRMLAAAPEVTAPVLAVQGTRDPVVAAAQTRRLLQRFANNPAYVEVDAEHDLTLPDNPGWPAVEAAVLAFAQRMRG